jgi:nitroreductase
VTEDIYDLAKRRKTVRKFSLRPVDWKEIIKVIKNACQAPSGANSQPWRFLIVTDTETKRRIRKACEQGEKEFYSNVNGELREWLLRKELNWRKPFLEEAPFLTFIFSEKKAPYSIQSTWLAIGYILLMIEKLGLGTVTYTPSIAKDVLNILDVPEGYRLEVILPIGFSADEKAKELRFKFNEVTYINSWGRSPKISN